jgi:hypothetical protein
MFGSIGVNYYNLGIALLITLIVEVVVVVFISRKSFLLVGTVIVINLITNPLMNILLATSNHFNGENLLYLLELLVIIVEGTIYYIVTKRIYQAFTISIIANVCSYVVGILLIPIIF